MSLKPLAVFTVESKPEVMICSNHIQWKICSVTVVTDINNGTVPFHLRLELIDELN